MVMVWMVLQDTWNNRPDKYLEKLSASGLVKTGVFIWEQPKIESVYGCVRDSIKLFFYQAEMERKHPLELPGFLYQLVK